MKLAMSVELEDLRFAMKQIIDLKSLTDDQHHQFESNSYDIIGIYTQSLASALELGGVIQWLSHWWLPYK